MARSREGTYATSPTVCLSSPTCSTIPARIETRSRILRSSSSIRSRRLPSEGFSGSGFLAERGIGARWLAHPIRAGNAFPRQERVAHGGKLAFSRAAQGSGVGSLETFEVAGDCQAQVVRRLSGRGVCPSRGLRDDLVDNSQLQE